MLIHYHPNPLRSVIELDDHDRETLRLKLIIDDLRERIYSAYFYLEPGECNDVNAALRSLDVLGLEDAPFDRKIDKYLAMYIEELRASHCGDCTCVPCSCAKCYAEELLGIDTIAGLGKHAANKIESAFADDRTLDQAIAWLADYQPVRGDAWQNYPVEDFDRHIPRWIKEAQHACDWLRAYRQAHGPLSG